MIISLAKSAKDRLEILEEYFPDIFKRVSQQHISSYLGITRQSLNRLRREKNNLCNIYYISYYNKMI